MNQIRFQQGATLYTQGLSLKNLSVIISGSVSITTPYGKILLKEGDCVGILDISSNTYLYNYIANTNVILSDYPILDKSSLPSLFDEDKELSLTLGVSITNQINQLIENYSYLTFGIDNLCHYMNDTVSKYQDTCKKFDITPQPFLPLKEISPITKSPNHSGWLLEYYESILQFSSFEQQLLFKKYPIFCFGYLVKASIDASTITNDCENCSTITTNYESFLFSPDKPDIFKLWTTLHIECTKNNISDLDLESNIDNLIYYLNGITSMDKIVFGKEVENYRSMLALSGQHLSEQNIVTNNIADYMSLTNSFSYILNYANYSTEELATSQELLNQYSLAKEPLSNEDDMVTTRKQLTALFYATYIKVFLKTLKENSIPSIIKMFLYFGYMDEHLVGEDNSRYLQEIATSLTNQSTSGVYTFYEWLLAIYRGEKEPSRNEFDMDYDAYLFDLKSKGRINDGERAILLQDTKEKVIFELKNMFPIVNKITVGRITGYCPILSKQNIIKDLASSYVTTTTIKDAFSQILIYDYTAYHREIVYTNPTSQIDREYIQLQILPDVILLPSIGTRGIMWQEIEGKKRTTPGRMLLPIISTTDVTLQITQLTGEFRWEMCKRIQGSRWNDISTPSLTSDYCDYAQFYKKNKDISTEAKTKIKNTLTQAKNNFKTAFVLDYMIWIQHEGKGSPRLNKVVRNILFLYCPFSLAIRDKLSTHPLYTESLNQYTISQKRKLHHFNLLHKKLTSLGIELPKEIQEEITLINS